MKLVKKIAILLVVIFICIKGMAQSPAETQVLQLSTQIFKWEVDNKIDLIENVFHKNFVVVSSNGDIQNKENYIARLASGNFVHNSIDIEQSKATVVDNTATVVGKGKFVVTIAGTKIILQLLFIEVFTRKNKKSTWKVLAMKASNL
jgi:Domain of unknown function (DUF4440)